MNDSLAWEGESLWDCDIVGSRDLCVYNVARLSDNRGITFSTQSVN